MPTTTKRIKVFHVQKALVAIMLAVAVRCRRYVDDVVIFYSSTRITADGRTFRHQQATEQFSRTCCRPPTEENTDREDGDDGTSTSLVDHLPSSYL